MLVVYTVLFNIQTCFVQNFIAHKLIELKQHLLIKTVICENTNERKR